MRCLDACASKLQAWPRRLLPAVHALWPSLATAFRPRPPSRPRTSRAFPSNNAAPSSPPSSLSSSWSSPPPSPAAAEADTGAYSSPLLRRLGAPLQRRSGAFGGGPRPAGGAEGSSGGGGGGVAMGPGEVRALSMPVPMVPPRTRYVKKIDCACRKHSFFPFQSCYASKLHKLKNMHRWLWRARRLTWWRRWRPAVATSWRLSSTKTSGRASRLGRPRSAKEAQRERKGSAIAVQVHAMHRQHARCEGHFYFFCA